MTIEEAYLTYLQLVNRNFTNDNVDVDRSRFIISMNYMHKRYVEWVLDKRNEDDLRDIQELLVLDKALTIEGEDHDHKDFNLPEDYFNLSALRILASKKGCKNIRIYSHEIKNDNVEEYLSDCFNEPSFEYRETFYTLNSENVSIYFSDFDVTKAFLSYYRYPSEVDIEGYITLDNKQSVNKHPELSDRITHRILMAMSREYSAVNEEYNKYKVDTDRLFSKI